MTHKQLENLKIWFVVKVRMHHENPEEITKALHLLQDFFKAGYEMNLYEYKEIAKYQNIVVGAGLEEMDKIRSEKTA